MFLTQPFPKHITWIWLACMLFACSPPTGKQANANAKNTSIPVGNSPFKGSKSAPVTIIEFSDFQCPFCKRVTGTLDQISKTYGDQVRVVSIKTLRLHLRQHMQLNNRINSGRCMTNYLRTYVT